jgi:putative ABC transport system permease protein
VTGLVIGLAWKDVRHDRRLFLCFALALAAVLAPIIVLLGLKTGVVERLRRDLVEDPRAREITLLGNHAFEPAFIDEIAARPETQFIVPRTRSLAANVYLSKPGNTLDFLPAELQPTKAGDPLLPGLPPATGTDKIIVSTSAAARLGLDRPGPLELSVVRRLGGNSERLKLAETVVAIAPAAAFNRDGVFADPALLEAVEAFIDGAEVTDFSTPPAPVPRPYAGFRLYAKTIDDVEPLQRFLSVDKKLEVRSRADEIASIKSLDRNLTIIFALVAAIGAFGYAMSLAASLWANVERKSHELGLARLLGIPAGRLLVFPIVQAVAVALLGSVIAILLAFACAGTINRLYVAGFSDKGALCVIAPLSVAAVAALTLVVAILAAGIAGSRARRLEITETLRRA